MRDHNEESFSDGTPLPPEEPPPGKGKGPSQAQQLMAMAEDTYRLIRSTDGRAYAVPKIGPQIAVPLASKSENSLRARLAASLHRQTGQVASGSNLSDALTVLMGEASELDPRPVWHPGADQPAGGGLPAGHRLGGGRLPDRHPAPHPPRPGQQGTAKSNLIRTLLALVDQQPAAERTPPKDNREWAIFARASWAFSHDNITDIPPWLSNALCKDVTGDAILQRVLHSDDDIGVYSFQRVIALTTIAIRHEVAGDLADRILLVEPEVIEKRRTEADITAARAAALPGALGAVLDLVAGVLRELPGTSVENAPRMADFAKVLAALDTVTGWGTLASYRAKVASLALSLIEGNTFAYAIYRLATLPSPGGLDPGPWEGTAAELLDTLRRICTDARMAASDLPGDVRAVGRQVREIAPSLRKAGIDIRPRKTGPRRLLRITKIENEEAGPKEPGTPLSLETKKDMSHMSHRRITAGHRARKVGHCPVPPMSHMSHPRGPAMSLMSHMGHSTVPPSAQVSGPMGHVGRHPGPFLTWLLPPGGPRSPVHTPERGDACTPPAQLVDGRPYRRACQRHCRPRGEGTGRHPPPPIETHGVRACPHPATRAASRSTWPRSAGTSCRCPRPASARSATVAPAGPGTASPPTWLAHAPA